MFKGDKAEKLLDAKGADAEDAIKAFYGLASVEELIALIEREFNERSFAGGTTNRTLTLRKNKIAEWDVRLNALKQEARSLEKTYSELHERLPDLKIAYEEILSKNSESENRRQRLNLERVNGIRDVSTAAIAAFDAVKNPFSLPGQLGELMRNLKGSFDTLKLPGTSIEFFKELAEEASCVCGRPLDATSRSSIIANAKTYLSDEHVTVVNGMKKDITDYDTLASGSDVHDIFSRLEEAISAYDRKKAQLARLEASVKATASAEDQAVIEEHNQLLAEIGEVAAALERLKSPADVRVESIMRTNTPELVGSIPAIENVMRALRAELAQQEGVVADYEAKEVLKNVLSEAIRIALPNLAQELTEMTNAKLRTILPTGTAIRVSRISTHIHLSTGHKELEGDKEKGSGGENVAIAYSFASSVIENSGVKFPLIVDHPVTALMSPARTVVGTLMAKIGHQFTGFIIDTEREAFVEAIETSGCDVNYFTIYRDIDGNRYLSDSLPDNDKFVQRTSNGVVCTDRKFFLNFQRQAEAR